MGFIERVRKEIERHKMIRPGERVIVAVSGGPDSVALLNVLHTLASEYRISLHVAHFNHQLRGLEAEQDARFVEDLARGMGLPVTVGKGDVAAYSERQALSIEEAGRVLRYDFLRSVAREIGADAIALGHNCDDQAETILMRILRGAGRAGLAGIPPVREEALSLVGHEETRVIRFIRPFLGILREEIEAYCRTRGLATRLDRTNLEPEYLRNKIRLELIPFLEREYCPDLKKRLSVIAEIMREEDEYLDREAQDHFEHVLSDRSESSLEISVSHLLGLPWALRRRIIRLALQEILSSLRDIDFRHIEDVLDLACSGRSGLGIDLPCRVRVSKEYDRLVLEKNRLQDRGYRDKSEWSLDLPGAVDIPHGFRIAAEEIPREEWEKRVGIGEYDAYFDLDHITLPLLIRFRRPGDRFQPLGLGGAKKLKDFFIDAKVSRRIRDTTPLVLSGNEIIWVVGFRIDERFKVTRETARVLHLSASRIQIAE